MPDRQMAKPSAKPGAPESTGGVEQKAVNDSHLSLLIEDWERSNQQLCDHSIPGLKAGGGQLQHYTDAAAIEVSMYVCFFVFLFPYFSFAYMCILMSTDGKHGRNT